MSEQEETELLLVDAYPVDDKYVDGLGRIERTGQNVRFVFYTGRPKLSGEYDREVATRVVMPMEGIMSLLNQIVTICPLLGLLDAEQLHKVVAGASQTCLV